MAGLDYTKAMLVALWTETLLYGMNTVLFITCIYYVVVRNKAQNKPFLVTAILLYVLCTAHVINTLRRAISAFTGSESSPVYTVAYYKQLWNGSSVLHHAVYCANSAIADGLLIYRLYVLWDRRKTVIIGPTIALVAAAGCGFRSIWGFQQGDDIYAPDIYTWSIALFSLSLSLNVVVTCLIGENKVV
ncbi:hypothetical protein VNI00_019132 [Paramarasmius palmivorus]|uniref:Integral membrane protein n=1 Tax=Paramarasmius palmivorus TaxID=297713 RepID=A0AAW0ART2_9AGAR